MIIFDYENKKIYETEVEKSQKLLAIRGATNDKKQGMRTWDAKINTNQAKFYKV